ncbi:MAG: hypothetical protein IKS59_06750 [Aeriscardovia sp.]|nr:hypothetical protein [Aeriscardovia sp.]
MISPNERILIEIIKRNSKERAAAYLQDYIQRNGFLNNEVGDIVKKLLEEKANEPKPKPDVVLITEVEQMIKEIEGLPDTIYSDSIMDVEGVSWKYMKDKVINIIKKYIE